MLFACFLLAAFTSKARIYDSPRFSRLGVALLCIGGVLSLVGMRYLASLRMGILSYHGMYSTISSRPGVRKERRFDR